MEIITPTERAYLLRRYRIGGLGPEATVTYAERTAVEYAERYASSYLPCIKQSIARLFIRYLLENDPGEKRLLRAAVDSNLQLGKAINAYPTA